MILDEIMTPQVEIDLSRVARNIDRFQAQCDRLKINARPHIKTHKIPELARRQLAAGAVGICCQKLTEAEAMADAGIKDILLTYNIIGAGKLERLHRLSRRCRLSVVADHERVVRGLATLWTAPDAALSVLIECDTGAGRCGVQTAQQVVDLARIIKAAPGLDFAGLMTYPAMDSTARVHDWLVAARDLLATHDITCAHISSGGTPNLAMLVDAPVVTEHRAGTYIYNDRSLLAAGCCAMDDCALQVVATVVSRPTPMRAIMDAGSKALSSDLLGLEDYGMIPLAPRARISSLSEEHGIIDLTASDWDPQVGDRVRVLPNHACVVSNLFDYVILIEADGRRRQARVAARGCVI